MIVLPKGGIFKLLRSPGIDSASLCSLAGRHDNHRKIGIDSFFFNILSSTKGVPTGIQILQCDRMMILTFANDK
jgi:hypothetical protein